MRASPTLLSASFAILGCSNTTPPPPPMASAPAPLAASAAPSAVAPGATASPSRVTDTIPTKLGDLKVTPILHASTLLQIAGKAIYVDPFSKGDFTGLPKADYVLVTDVHFDHMDPKAVAALAKPETRIVAPPAVAAEQKGWSNVITLSNGEKKAVGPFLVEAVPMYNLVRGPKPGAQYHDKGRGNGYVLTFGDKRVYFSGDTECTPEMKALTAIDVAFVCMNLPYTMPPKEAAACVDAFKPKILFPYHYGVPGGPASNLDELKAALDPKAGVDVRLRKWY
jgi:L-ascorbate metabolism protein UlaG (beta-lactamase superfamily)